MSQDPALCEFEGCSSVSWQDGKERLEAQIRLRLNDCLSAEATMGLTASQIITLALQKLHETFPDMRAVYATLGDSGKQTVHASIGPTAMLEIVHVSVRISQAPDYLEALRQQSYVRIEDVAQEMCVQPLSEHFAQIGCRATLDVARTITATDLGVFSLHSLSPRQWPSFQVQILTMVAQQATHLLKYVQLFEEKRQSDRALRRANKRVSNILDSITDAYVALDRNWQITFVNPKAEQLMRFTRQDLLGRTLWEVYPHLRNYPLYAKLESVMKRQIALQFEELFPNGGLWLDFNVFPSQDGLSIYARDITAHKRAEERLQQGMEKMQRSLNGVVQAMSFAVEIRDPYTAGHQRRVSVLAAHIAGEMGLRPAHIEEIRIAGLLHDIGKIAIPAEILTRPGALTSAELSIVQMHPEVGYNILKDIEFSVSVAIVALQHHERLDGSGYPKGLREEEIALEARIIAVADVVEAMGSHRPYRPALGLQAALEEILLHRATRYDGAVVDACLALFQAHGFDLEFVLSKEVDYRAEIGDGEYRFSNS